MAKFYGSIGFAEDVEVRPGYIKNQITPHEYYGDVIRQSHRYQSSESVNDNIKIDTQISIVADVYANNNFGAMRWVEFGGTKWKISSIEIKYPRLIITIGEVWNEDTSG